MVVKQRTSELTLAPNDYKGAVQELLKAETWSKLPWWEQLNRREQGIVMRESLDLGTALMGWGEMKYRIGQHLVSLQEVLTPHGLFDTYLHHMKRVLNRSVRSFYRDIDDWKEAATLPESVAKAAVMRNFPVDKLKTVRKMLPLPKDIKTVEDALPWIDKAQEYSKKNPQIHEMDAREIPVNDTELAHDSFVRFKVNYMKLPPRKKASWARRVIGMQMTLMGLSSPQQFEPEAIPNEFLRGRGRPSGKVIEGEAKEA